VSVAVEFTAHAQQVLGELHERWVGEHGAADNPLLDEIDQAVERLRVMPELGRVCGRDARGRPIRQLLLPTQWTLYYTYSRTLNVLWIRTVWYARRGRPPALLRSR
jgi:hypothetical protein